MQSLVLSGNFRELSPDELYEVNGGIVLTIAALYIGAKVGAKIGAKIAAKEMMVGAARNTMITTTVNTSMTKTGVVGAAADVGLISWASGLFK